MLTLCLAGALAAAPVSTDVSLPAQPAPLSGTLLAPEGETSAVAVILPGSGPTDRDGNQAPAIRASTYRLLADLRHPGLVRILDAAWEGQGAPYLVLELVDGPDLATVLADGPLDPQRVAAIGRDVASALAYLHSEGVVHRDVKPANVLLDPSGGARICDLGISLDVGEPDPHGRPGHTVGSLAYLAPEQVLGEAIGTAVDVFALGLLLLEALTGHREYSGPDDSSAWARVHRSPTIPISLGAAWTRLLAAMTARVPAERPSAADVAAHLEALLAVEDATSDVPTPAATHTGSARFGRHRAGRPVQDLAATVA